jgi:uncharacterized protein YqhQ
MSQRFSYGGQAVIEGVMMRGRHSLAIAVRRSDGVVLHEENRLCHWTPTGITGAHKQNLLRPGQKQY